MLNKKTCKNCGKKVSQKDNFCPNCGSVFKVESLDFEEVECPNCGYIIEGDDD